MWDKITRLSNKKALKNADTYAFFGLFAKLADRKFILNRNPKKANRGKLEYVADYLEKRRALWRRMGLGRVHARSLGGLLGGESA